jgi:hypothetical protein
MHEAYELAYTTAASYAATASSAYKTSQKRPSKDVKETYNTLQRVPAALRPQVRIKCFALSLFSLSLTHTHTHTY